MSAIRLRALLGGPLREVARHVYPDPSRREIERYQERSAHGGLTFLAPGEHPVELVPTPLGEMNFGTGQYMRVRQRWSSPSDWKPM